MIAISLEKHSSLTGHVYVIIMASVPRRSLSGSEGGAQRRVSSVIFLAAVVTHAHWFNERYNGCIVEQNHAGPPCSCYRPRHEFYTFSGKSRTWGHVIWLWWSLLKWLAYRQRLESPPCPCQHVPADKDAEASLAGVLIAFSFWVCLVFRMMTIKH